MQLGKLSAGLIFESQFLQSDADWIITPASGSHAWVAGGGLTLTGDASVLRPIPADGDFSMEVTLQPTPGTGTCGLLLYREDNYQVRFSAFEDGSTLPMAMMIRRTDGVYLFMAKISGVWQIAGSIRDDQVLYMGGFVADGASLALTAAIGTGEEDILVQGLDETDMVTLEDSEGTIVASAVAEAGGAVLDLGWFSSVTGTLRVTSGGSEIAVTTATFYAGDTWTVSLPVSVTINSTPVPFGEQYAMTTLEATETVLQVDIFNESETETLTGRKLKVMKSDPYPGVEWADIAPDVNDSPGIWADETALPDLLPLTGVRVWVRVLRQADFVPYTPMRWAKFRVVFI